MEHLHNFVVDPHKGIICSICFVKAQNGRATKPKEPKTQKRKDIHPHPCTGGCQSNWKPVKE